MTVGNKHSCLVALLISLCLHHSPAFAHPEGFSGLHVTIDGDRMRAAITVHTRDMGDWFPPAKFPDYVADVTAEMEKTVDEIIEMHIDGQPLPVGGVKAFLLEVGLIEIDVDFQLPASSDTAELLVWSKHLIRLPRGHQQLLFVEDRREIAPDAEHGVIRLEDVLSVERDAAAVWLPPVTKTDAEPMPPAAPAKDNARNTASDNANNAAASDDDHVEDTEDGPDSLGAGNTEPSVRTPKRGTATGQSSSRISYFRFGLEHILSGYDHLLFLAALLLACTTFKEAAAIITCFTIAHSITLALAALDLVRIPPSIVEPAIALTIVYVAVENLVHASVLWRRAAVTCGFGLIHGLGFAGALRDTGLGSMPGGIFWPLLKFNLGVEAGQLFVAALCLPLLVFARRRERASTILLIAGSTLIAIIGGLWFVSRVVSILFVDS